MKIRSFAGNHKLTCGPERRQEAGRKLQIKRQENLRNRQPEDYRVNPNQFIHVTTPEAAYILGLLWADGYVSDKDVRLKVVEKDARIFYETLKKTGIWACKPEKTERGRQPVWRMSTFNRPLANHLHAIGYAPHTKHSAEAVLATVPVYLWRYWFRGLIDGDGCFVVNMSKRTAHFSVSSVFDQDWTYFTRQLDTMDIDWTIERRISKYGRNSIVRLSSRENITQFGAWLYEGYPNDGIGLPRKHFKWMQARQLHNERRRPVLNRTRRQKDYTVVDPQ